MAGRISRRTFLGGSFAVVAAACSSGGGAGSGKTNPPTGSPGSIASLKEGAGSVSLLSSSSPVKPGRSYFGFDLVTDQGGVITGGAPQVWVAAGETVPAQGPFGATWYPFAPASEFDDDAPRTALPGTYATQIEIPRAGTWTVAVKATSDGKPFVGTATLTAVDEALPGEVGSEAISVKTPVATTEAAARQICTRNPPDPMHAISLDAALKNGKPTVVTFATPLLCESQLCGPVVDEVLLASRSVGADKANFIHVEEFLPGPDLTPPPVTLENQSKPFKAWRLTTEPWTFVIDGDGVVQARFEGPVTAPQVEAALARLP